MECTEEVSDHQVMAYRKRGKIRWAKLSQIPPNEVFMGKLSQCLTFKALKQCHYMKLV